ncbi:hypothetical protein [uncultured Thomasclavelia sp.]|uniref:hypothetical protein n=1 Tax=uncultured Thomasclavelia sp. TaxID=3025759 RepID=UPI0025FE4DEF|nr:hypothetical protein [uncultured Thomasclavelia sp.]
MFKKFDNNNITNHDKNLDYIQDNYPELLDDYIDIFENCVFASNDGVEIEPEDMIEVIKIVKNFKDKQYKELN